MAMQSLLDLITLQNADPSTGLVEDVTTFSPEFNVFEAIPRVGINYPVARRTALPTVAFRRANEGVVPSKSQFKRELKEMLILESLVNMDEAVLKADDESVGSLWMNEAKGVLQQALITVGSQVWYGTSADAKGFLGARTQLTGNIGAGGSTSSTSAYLLWMDRQQGCRFDVGNGGTMALSNPTKQQVTDPADSTKSFMAWVGNLNARLGFNVISANSVYAVTGIDTSNKLTDDKAAQLVAIVPLARRNNMRWFLNRRAAYTLQNSRSALGYQPGQGGGGAPAWAPAPTTLEGFPITVTDSLLNTESN